jgi:hypothetical protein
MQHLSYIYKIYYMLLIVSRSDRLGVWNHRFLRIFTNRIEWGSIFGGSFVQKQSDKSPIPVIRLVDFYQSKGSQSNVFVVCICVKERITSLVRTIDFRCFSYKDMMDIIACLRNIKVSQQADP